MNSLFPNEDTKVNCGRHPECSCTEMHDSQVKSIIDRDHRIEALNRALFTMNEELAELRCAKSALIEVLEMAEHQGANKKTHLILKTEGGEESPALLIPQEEVESVLERYKDS